MTWPLTVALGRPRADELARDMVAVSAYVSDLRAWQDECGFEVRWAQRRAGGTQEIPTHIVVADVDMAARILGRDARRSLRRMRGRARTLADAFPHLSRHDAVHVLKRTHDWEDLDFELLLDAGRWFQDRDAHGLTPRQVPLAGFHAKWLNGRNRRGLVGLLAGKDDLGLVETAPSVDFAYLDPTHLTGGGRRYDSHVAGDAYELPYDVEVALIVENKDTYRHFPATPGAVCIFGSGATGPSNVSCLPWVERVPRLVYWGDMDADGLQILNAYRERGLHVESLLMDVRAYERYERIGTSLAAGKEALKERRARDLPHLSDPERALYLMLTDPAHTGHRRIEQERIPLADARLALESLLSTVPSAT